MLNKKLVIISLFLFFFFVGKSEVLADDACVDIRLQKGQLKLQYPLKSSGIANFKIENNCSEELILRDLSSPDFRLVAVYEERLSEIGAKTKKEVDSVNLRANKTTEFSDGKFQIILSGPNVEPEINNEIVLNVKFEDKPELKTVLRVVK